ncbi:GDSL-type esterase/lipase family protein [Vibrio fluvialis]
MKNNKALNYSILLLSSMILLGCNKKKEEPENVPPPAPVINHYYNDKVSFFNEFGKKNYDVVFIGDSITDYADWNEIFEGYNIANRGIKSDTTLGVMERLDSIKSSNAKVGFLMIGTNDVTAKIPSDEIVSNIEKIILELSPDMTIYLQSILLTRRDERNPIILELNKRLSNLATQHNVHYIDLNDILAPKGILSDKYTSDGIHINGKAYHLWAKRIQKYLPTQR